MFAAAAERKISAGAPFSISVFNVPDAAVFKRMVTFGFAWVYAVSIEDFQHITQAGGRRDIEGNRGQNIDFIGAFYP